MPIFTRKVVILASYSNLENYFNQKQNSPLDSTTGAHCRHALRQYLSIKDGLASHSPKRPQAEQQGSSLKHPVEVAFIKRPFIAVEVV